MCVPDENYWLTELERRANALRNELPGFMDQRQSEPSRQPDDVTEPEVEEVNVFVQTLLIPEIDRALASYQSGATQVEMYNWQVGPLAISIIITANPSGVVIDSTMPYFARKLYDHYTHRGYTVRPLNHKDDDTMQEPTLVRINRAA